MASTKVLEARAIITAQDSTGNTFNTIANKVNAIGRSAQAVNRNVGAVNQTLQTQARFGKALSSAAGVAAVVAAHKVKEVAAKVVETYREFDDLRRYQKAILHLSDEQQKPLIDQALKLGSTTKFNDLQVLEAQLDLAQRGIKENMIRPIIEMAANYGQAMNTSLPDAAKTLEGIIFSTGQHMEDAGEALANANKTVNFAVKLAKIGGLGNEDVQQFFKFGGASGHVAGLSMETMGALAAIMRRSNIRGDEAGVAVRSIAGALVSPTKKGMDALAAMGINYSQFTKMPGAASSDSFNTMFQQNLGKKLSARQLAAVQGVLGDADVMGERGAFMSAMMPIIGEGFQRNKKGELTAASQAQLGKVLQTFHKMIVESVDTEGLLRAIIANKPSAAQLNAFFTKQQGGRMGTVTQHGVKLFDDYREQLRRAPDDFAASIANERMGGFAGAASRAEGALMNLYTALGRANDGMLTFGANLTAGTLNHLSKLGDTALQATSQLGLFAAALLAAKTAGVLGDVAKHARGMPVGAPSGAVPLLGVAGTIAIGGYNLSKYSTDTIFSDPESFKGIATNPLLGAMAPDMALGAAVANLDAIKAEQAREVAAWKARQDFTLGSMGGFQKSPLGGIDTRTLGYMDNLQIKRLKNSPVGRENMVSLDPNSKVDVKITYEVKPSSQLLDIVNTAKSVSSAGNANGSIGGVGTTGVGASAGQ